MLDEDATSTGATDDEERTNTDTVVEKRAKDEEAVWTGATGELKTTVDDVCPGLEVLRVEGPTARMELEVPAADVEDGVGELYGGGPTGLVATAPGADEAVEEPTIMTGDDDTATLLEGGATKALEEVGLALGIGVLENTRLLTGGLDVVVVVVVVGRGATIVDENGLTTELRTLESAEPLMAELEPKLRVAAVVVVDTGAIGLPNGELYCGGAIGLEDGELYGGGAPMLDEVA